MSFNFDTAQPESTEFRLADDIFVKSGLFQKGQVVPQHSHEYDHSTFIASGSLLAWREKEFLGEFCAPCSIFIKKHNKHTFEVTTENTMILCIHNISRSGVVDIHELHELSI